MASTTLQTAVRKLEAVGILRSKLTASELNEIRSKIRQQSVFSAKVSKAKLLEEIRKISVDVLTGKKSPFGAREVLRKTIERGGYKPQEGKKGTIEDLSSTARIDLIIRMQTEMARGYGLLVDAQKDLERFPFWELYRKYVRQEPRDWPARWKEAGRTIRSGKMVAPVNDRVWTDISAFGTPYPPFDYNSGMSVRRMNRARGEALGLRFPKAQKRKKLPELEPPTANVALDGKIAEQLLKDLGPGYSIKGGVLRKAVP